jgi:cation diffusion facilitator family transporter
MRAHSQHSEDKKKTAFISILASAGLVVTKIVVAIITGSLALLTEALHSLLDLGATTITYFAVDLSDRPADATHNYGHGKIESLAALFEVVFLLFIAAFATWEAIDRLSSHPHNVSAPPIVIGIILVSIIVDFFRSRALLRVAKETSSQALEADSLHFTSDMWASIAALCALIGIWLGFPQADAIAALVVAAIIIAISFGLGYRTINSLLDAAPAGSRELIEQIVSTVSGVVRVERARIRNAGAKNFCEIGIQIARTLPLQRIEEIKHAVGSAIQRALPNTDVIVTTEAVALADESIIERIMLIAARQHAFVHHITVQRLEGRLAIGLDLEVAENMPLAKAHGVATKLEAALLGEFGPETEVETHIEPLENTLAISAAPEEERQKIEQQVKEFAANEPALSNIHALRLRQTEAGRIVILHCNFPDNLSVRAVHTAVDEVERKLRINNPDIIRILIHAEPVNDLNPHY